ncbi:class D sortase [Candidatus Berkelbacteria bacterium]|nr:class D sortase [Candidatus Berkelbacteria bacterium]
MKQVELNEQDIKKLFKSETPSARFLRAIQKITKNLIYFGCLYLIFFYIINFSAINKQLAFWLNPPKFEPVVVNNPDPTPNLSDPDPEPLPNYSPRIQIPRVAIDAPIVMNVTAPRVVPELSKGVAHLYDSALPDQRGNTVIFGHSSNYTWSRGSYKSVFTLLTKLKAGDQIILPYKSQKYVYEVTGTKVISPYDLSVLKKTDDPILTLITCYPLGTSQKRWVVIAKLVNGEQTGVQPNDPLLSEVPTPR